MHRFLFIICSSLWSFLFSRPHPMCVCLSVIFIKVHTSLQMQWQVVDIFNVSMKEWAEVTTNALNFNLLIYLFAKLLIFQLLRLLLFLFCITLCSLYFSPSFYFFRSLLCIIPPLFSLKLFYLLIPVALSCVGLLSHIMLKDTVVIIIIELFICRFVDNSLSF